MGHRETYQEKNMLLWSRKSFNGTYRDIHSKRVFETKIPYDSLTCIFCKLIPNYVEFRMRLYRESRRNIKRHGIDTWKGRRMDHLTQTELIIVIRKQIPHID